MVSLIFLSRASSDNREALALKKWLSEQRPDPHRAAGRHRRHRHHLPSAALFQRPKLLCPACPHIVPGLAFRPDCGAARASPRSSHKARRASPPVPTDTTSENQ